jgi:tetratricopeptide (TPR) repeat protein
MLGQRKLIGMSTIPTTQLHREERLDEVLASYLEAVGHGQAPSRQHYLENYPDLADDLAAFFADQDRLDCLVAPLRSVTQEAAAARVGQVLGGYEILEEVARGGMGIVYKARQTAAGRIVALKMLRAGPHADTEDLQRFRTEIESVAALDHPHIVPIYEVGIHDGQPFFSMKFFEGGSLAATRREGPDPLSPRDAAHLVAVVARAVHHAHERGVLHRDLKPANVLLDKDGQPHVSDFGLAKRLQDEPGVLSPELALTQHGAVLGTPSYMAPEQAEGSKEGLTTAADVYSLGAILFELLTGRPPFKGTTPLETLRDVVEQAPPAPRKLRPGVAPDLETICLKCLEKEPRRRYGSALELAEDLERFLAGEPVRARAIGRLGRLGRWCRRKPLVASLSAGLVLALVGGLGLALWKGHEAQVNLDESEIQRGRAEANERQAEASFRQAHKAVNDFYKRVEAELANTPGLQPLRRRLLRDALGYYHEFLRQRGDDSGLRAELADAYHRVAWITAEVGSKTEALEAHRQALRLYRELLLLDPDNVSLQTKIAATQHNVGLLLAQTGHSAQAHVAYEKARSQYERLRKAKPKDVGLTYSLANTYNNLANLDRAAGRRDDARRLHEQARTLRAQLAKDHPREPKFRIALASSLHNLGVLDETSDQPRKALERYQQARALREQLVREDPRVLAYRSDLASSWHAVGLMQERLGEKDKALASYTECRALREELARANPGVPSYQVALAASHTIFGLALSHDHKNAAALAAFLKARDILEKIVRADPAYYQAQADLGNCYYFIALQQVRLRRSREALTSYRQAQAVQEKLVQRAPDNLDCRHDLSTTLGGLGLALGKLKKYDEARMVLAKGIEHERFALDRAPKMGGYRHALAQRYVALADVELWAGRTDAVAAAVRACRKICPSDGPQLVTLAEQMTLAADLSRRDKKADPSTAGRYEEEALRLLREAIQAGYKDYARLRTAPDLASLRKQAAFAKLLLEHQ